ncbi:MAG: protein kinase [archaeon]|nr:protein kinase [archaeon]
MKVDPKVLPEMKREILTLAELSGPFCVEFYASYFKDGDLWLAMELFDAGSVGDLLERRQRMTEEEIVALLQQTCAALQFLHAQPKVHRDIKAGNLMLNKRGTVKLGDFGLCSSIGTAHKLNTQVGSPFWMAPEIISGEGYDTGADIWSLGITILEATHREHEFFNRNPMTAMFQIVSEDPPALEDPSAWSPHFKSFLALCLTKDPAQRPAAAQLLSHPLLQSPTVDSSAVLTRLVEQHLLGPRGPSTADAIRAALGEAKAEKQRQRPAQADQPMESQILRFAMPDGTYRRLLIGPTMSVKDIIRKIAQKICLEIDDITKYSLSYLRKENLVAISDMDAILLPYTKYLQPHSTYFTFRQEPDTAYFSSLNDCVVDFSPTLAKLQSSSASSGDKPVRSNSGTVVSPAVMKFRADATNLLIDNHPGSLREFLRLLNAPNLPLVEGLIKSTPTIHSERLAQALVEVFESVNQAPRLFRRACEVEVVNLHPSKVNDIFRGTSLTGKMMTAYVKMVGTEYAQLVLRPILQPLLQLKSSLELDTARMEKTPNLIQDLLLLRTNMQSLQKVTREVFQSLFLSIDSMPASFRSICRELQMTVTHHLRDKHQFVPTSFLFLRYICPIIVSPYSFGIFSSPPPPHVSRTLVLLSKVINALASGVHFGVKEEYMTDMNPFLDEYRPMVTKYFDRVMASTAPSVISRRSVIVKSITVEASCQQSSDSIETLNLSHPAILQNLHFLVSLTSERFLHIGAALHILPPPPEDVP